MIALALLAACAVDDTPVTVYLTIEHTGPILPFKDAGVFETPEGGPAGPIGPGQRFAFEVDAAIGDRLSIASMLLQSNDVFLGAGPDGIALYDDRAPRTADVTAALSWWDAGTEADEPLALGDDQALRQGAAGQGEPDPVTGIRLATDPDLPAVADVARLEVAGREGTRFLVTLENVGSATVIEASDASLHPAPLGPGAWAVHALPDPFATPPSGWQAVVEDGDPSGFDATSGLTVPLGHPFYVVDAGEGLLFADGAPDPGDGLESLAEDGSAAALAATWSDRDAFDWGFVETPAGTGTYEPRPAFPGETFLLGMQARPRDRLHLAWMYAESNDVLFSLPPEGVELVDRRGDVVTGRIDVGLWDAGTEENQRPGYGPDQPARQAAPDTGPTEGGDVRPLDDDFAYGRARDLVRLEVWTAVPPHLLQ